MDLSDWHMLTRGTNGLLFGYVLVAVPMLVALIQGKAAASELIDVDVNMSPRVLR